MTWFYVEDNLAFHPKAVKAGNAAMGLWVRAGSWSGQQLTDGEVSVAVARSMGTPVQARALLDVGLWVPGPAGTYQFHEWEQRQRTRDQVEAKRKVNRDRLAKWRREHGEKDEE